MEVQETITLIILILGGIEWVLKGTDHMGFNWYIGL